MYCGFIDDTLFKSKQAVIEADKAYGQCVIDSQMANYFHTHMRVNDQRKTRLQLGGKAVAGQISFHYDAARHKSVDMFQSLSAENINAFFNILEMVYLSNGGSLGELNSSLRNSNLTKDVYVANTLSLSRVAVTAVIPDIDSLTPETKISMVTYFEFDVQFSSHQQETVRVFLDRKTFIKEYPFTTINDVIFPCKPEFILDPSKLPGVLDGIIGSIGYTFPDINKNIEPEDHSGLITHYTKYITKNQNGQALTTQLPFGILYQGAVPTSLEIREAIRNKLLGLGIASESIWESILPDLFVVAQFFIIPSWSNYTVKPEGILYPSVMNLHTLQNFTAKLFPAYEQTYLQENQEVLVYGQSDLFLTSIPDKLNKDEFSIRKKHPTYLHHLEQDGSGFLQQTPATRDFNQKLNRTMAVANGAETNTVTVTQEIDGRIWHSFVSGKTEYHVLSQTSFDEFFNQ